LGFTTDNLLSLILFSPLVGGLLVLLLPGENKNLVRRAALAVSLVPFILTLVAWLRQPNGSHLQHSVSKPRIHHLAQITLGVEGLGSGHMESGIQNPVSDLGIYGGDHTGRVAPGLGE